VFAFAAQDSILQFLIRKMQRLSIRGVQDPIRQCSELVCQCRVRVGFYQTLADSLALGKELAPKKGRDKRQINRITDTADIFILLFKAPGIEDDPARP
jgi:hypothetical protein